MQLPPLPARQRLALFALALSALAPKGSTIYLRPKSGFILVEPRGPPPGSQAYNGSCSRGPEDQFSEKSRMTGNRHSSGNSSDSEAADAVGAEECGVVEKERIVGGRPVVGPGFPWFVALTTPGFRLPLTVNCGGSLITRRHVLTAAHCYPRDEEEDWTTRYALVFLLGDRCRGPVREGDPQAESVAVHPGFSERALVNDVAVIKLQRDVDFMPICLPKGRSRTAGKGTILGFGSIRFVDKAKPCRLQIGLVDVLTRNQCLATDIGPAATLPGVVCAGKRDGSVDSCDGDSGGPLQMIDRKGRSYVRGIVSFGIGCGVADTPGVYTDVGAHLEWIRSQIEPNRGKKGGLWELLGLPNFHWLPWSWAGAFSQAPPAERSANYAR